MYMLSPLLSTYSLLFDFFYLFSLTLRLARERIEKINFSNVDWFNSRFSIFFLDRVRLADINSERFS